MSMKWINRVKKKHTHEISSKLKDKDFIQWRAKIRRAMEFSVEQMPRQVPEFGREGRFGYKFDLQGTQNCAVLLVECSTANDTHRILSIHVQRKGYDLSMMHIIRSGTRAQLLDYLKDENHIDELFDSIQHLSERIDEHY